MVIDLDSIYASLTPAQMEKLTEKATSRAKNVIQTFAIQREMQTFEQKNVAIIRKGGMGIPIITGVIFFIFYYIIDNTGYKAAKNGMMQPWFGTWLSSMVLAPIGIWLTWRAVNDSPLFDWDTYKIRFTQLLRKVMRRSRPILEFAKKHREQRSNHSAFFGRRFRKRHNPSNPFS